MSGMSMYCGYFCRPMSSALRHLTLLAFVFVTAECALLWGQGYSQDSLQLKGMVTPTADSVLSNVSLNLEIGQVQLQPGDSIAMRIPRSWRLRVWGESPLGRLQFEAGLPQRVDSTEFTLQVDSTGTWLYWPTDTLRTPWTPKTNGCFPVASAQSVERILAEVGAVPFESKRFDVLSGWMMDQCLSTAQIERLASAFDDEARRLKLIQRATCSTPSRMARLEMVFSSSHYRGVFLEWTEQRP